MFSEVKDSVNKKDRPYVVLDFQHPHSSRPSYVDITKELDHFEGKNIVWAEPAPSPGVYQFLMYKPSICGSDMLFNSSSNWLTLVEEKINDQNFQVFSAGCNLLDAILV